MGSSKGREHIAWGRNNYLRLGKMLTWTIGEKEPGLPMERHFKRFQKLYEPVSTIVLLQGITYEVLHEHTLEDQNRVITANKIYQRYDKVKRYGEFNSLKDAVWQAYHQVEGLPLSVFDVPLDLTKPVVDVTEPDRDSRRNFSDEQLLTAIKNQDGHCMGCNVEFGPYCTPVADHGIPWSWGIKRGGTTTQANCVALCYPCNERKGAQHILTFVREMVVRLTIRGRQKISA